MSELTSRYLNLARMAETIEEKVRFFDENQRAFFLDPQSMEFDHALKAYAEKLECDQIKADALVEELEDMKWVEMPEAFKIFAIEYCIIDGNVYAS